MTERATAIRLVGRYALTPADLVVEVGSEDGTFLRALAALGPRVIGVEPEPTGDAAAAGAGLDILRAPFDRNLADLIRRRYGPARAVVTRSSHSAEPVFLAAAVRCLSPDGVVVLIGDVTLTECRPLDPPIARAA
jgi:hypothetical protein